MRTNSGHEMREGNGKYYPFDGRKETHPDWMFYTLKQLDPFQDAVPCFQREEWHAHIAAFMGGQFE